jgi:hypothetical protein
MNIPSQGISLGYDLVWQFKRRFFVISLIILLATNLVHSIFAGVILGLATFIILSLSISSDANLKPRLKSGDALKQSIIAVLRVSLIAAFVMGISFSLIYSVLVGIIMSISTFIFAAIIIANVRSIVLYMLLRWFLMQKKQAPLNYETLLADAVNLAFLRKVGGGYIFIHRYLLEYFAGLEIKEQ